MTNLRKLARGQDCQIRAPGCNFDPETTVLAHLPGGGMGAKRHDLHGAWACSACHDLVDGRRKLLTGEPYALGYWHTQGVIRTQEKLIEMGVLK
jgi:hypothetical protein